MDERINIEVPRWDQSTFSGRFYHFFAITNWVKSFKTNHQLDEAKRVVEDYK